MANIKATVTTQGNVLKSRVNPQKKLTVTEFKLNSSTIRLGDLLDVDTSAASDGALLLYNDDQQKFEATPNLDNRNTKINGGHY